MTLMFMASSPIAASLSFNAFLQFSKPSQIIHSPSQLVNIKAPFTQMNLCLSSIAEEDGSQFGASLQFDIDALCIVLDRFLKVEFIIALDSHFQSPISLFLHRHSSSPQDHECSVRIALFTLKFSICSSSVDSSYISE